MKPDSRLDALIDAVLDGTPVDWDGVESSADASTQRHLPQLRLVAGVALAHDNLHAADAPPAFARGQEWGDFVLVDLLGAGASGEVWRATDRQLDRDIALKLIPTSVAEARGSAVLIKEASLLARVRHPHVVIVHGAAQRAGHVGIWMELIDGRTLATVLDENGPFSAPEVAALGMVLCRALAAVHHAGLVHGDVKAHNVMREHGGRIVLMDFGAGHLSTRPDGSPAPRLVGTPLYVAPEVLAGHGLSTRSDIYSLGVLLYHLLTGRYPVTGRTVDAVRQAHRTGERVLLRDLRPDLPPALTATIERAIAAEPSARPATVGELESSLLASLAAVPAAARRRTPTRWAIAASVAVAVAVVSGLLILAPGRLARLREMETARIGGGDPRPQAAAAGDVGNRKVPMPKDAFRRGPPSDDGRLMPFVDGKGDVAIYEFATGQTRKVTRTDSENETADSGLVISRDSRRIAYLWKTLDNRLELRVSGLDGANRRVLVRPAANEDVSAIAWMHDGERILALHSRADWTSALVTVDAFDGTSRVVTELGRSTILGAAISRDDRFVAWDAPQSDESFDRDIFVAGIDGSNQRRLVAHAANDFFPVWLDGGRLAFTSTRAGTVDLWMTGADQRGEASLVFQNIGAGRLVGVPRDGRYYYMRQTADVDVYVAPLGGDGLVSGEPARIEADRAASNQSVAWSRDGRQLGFVTHRGPVRPDRGSSTLTVRDMESTTGRTLTPRLGFFLLPTFSPDGRSMMVRGIDIERRFGLHRVDLETGRTAPVVIGPPDDLTSIGFFDWTGDNHVIYVRPRAGIFRRALTTGVETALLTDREVRSQYGEAFWGGLAVSRDGQVIAYNVKPGGSPHRICVKRAGTPATEVLRGEPGSPIEVQTWTEDGSALLLTRPGSASGLHALWRLTIESGRLEPMGVEMWKLRNVRIRPGGRQIAFTAGDPISELWVLEGVLPAAR